MELDKILSKLNQTRTSSFTLQPPSHSGVYALFLKPSSTLKGFQPGNNGLIYIGMASDLAERDIENHFSSKHTGFSTLRRSLGAILKQKLKLIAVPRSSGTSDTNTRNYKFLPDGEHRLTNWMKRNLEIGVCAIESNYESIERQLIVALKPVLNLKGWDNPYRKDIKALRKVCAEEARQNRPADR